MNPACNYYERSACRSCQWIERPYTDQVDEKERILLAELGITESLLLPTITSSLEKFRNRAKMVVTGTVEEPIIGIVGESDRDEGREILDCPIHHPALNAVIRALPEFISEYHLIPYHIASGKGELKGLILFHSPETRQTYLRFVLRSKECVSRLKKMLPALQKALPEVVCVSANLQPLPAALLEGKEEIFITDRRSIDHRLGEVALHLSPQAFVQTNVEVATRLYQTAADWIEKIHPKKMLELFCGQGAFSFFAARSAERILGIEINADAVRTANETARKMNWDHLSFECRDAKDAPSFGADLILVNPPRRGLAESVRILLDAKPEYLIYSSCSVHSLSKDLQILSKEYTIEKAQIFDLFPHTAHFETLVHLRRKAEA